jgi:MoaA/NifB/PqqE/SkfB family radical SAM enzyme
MSSVTPEEQAEQDLAAIPFWESQHAITADHCRMKSWRYFLEINSACNLRCPTCTKGNQEGYEHQTGLMDPDLMEKIIDKIKSENPAAIVFLYGNSEPFIHPRLAECIASVKRRELNCQLSTNLNFIRNVEGVLAAKPDMIIISLSGFTQEVYVKGHAGGQIEKVKENMKVLAEAYAQTDKTTVISVNYHVYTDNGHEIDLMRAYAESLGLGFFTSYARAISMENAIQYNRSLDLNATPFEVQPGRPDLNHALPPIGQTYIEAMKRLVIPPDKSPELFKDFPIHSVCPIGWMFCFIRHDGKTEMCACVADRRLTLGDFLDNTQDQLIQQRTGHAVCQQCTKYHLRYYFHMAHPDQHTKA